MTFTSKFEIEEEIYFFNDKTHKIETGKITGICLSCSMDKEFWSYWIERKEGDFPISINEPFVFKDRDDVFKFAYSITEGI